VSQHKQKQNETEETNATVRKRPCKSSLDSRYEAAVRDSILLDIFRADFYWPDRGGRWERRWRGIGSGEGRRERRLMWVPV
jgi:hypothetical protein